MRGIVGQRAGHRPVEALLTETLHAQIVAMVAGVLVVTLVGGSGVLVTTLVVLVVGGPWVAQRLQACWRQRW